MNNKLLLPNKYKVIGWIVFLVFAVMGIATLYFEFSIPGFVLPIPVNESKFIFEDSYNLTNETALAGTVVGLLMICFAREPKEDEYISLIRLRCWQWSVLASYIVLLVLNFSLYGMSFFVGMVYNLFTVLVIFIARFYYSIYKLNKEQQDEE
ncbi:hypothetical protein [Pedobacter nutrimenti]|jgi:hypothetical protein|uniref:Uncharacterized protein n=1 Tax=Pedobacter nutrimenti TaxID=1241337 RepID=A0A318U9N3_9SPHI|nr:hypothetical protein [Pedobacter nutrimenti]PYF68896.1 hypothetical protein B0O44_11174 [Pedobacter nutrimenti]